MLKPYERDDYDLVVLDNGSDEGKSSKYTTYRSDENVFYGGGLDMAMRLFLDSPEYDSFVVLNSDMVVHGYKFINKLREVLFSDKDIMIASPCIVQPELTQCFWRQMHCWNEIKPREVPFVDFQCALMKRELAEKIQSFGSKYGWVQDMVAGFVCEDNGWKIVVCDYIPAIHIGNGTVKDNPQLSDYNIRAQQEMNEYFVEKNLVQRALDMRTKLQDYHHDLSSDTIL
jgi:GT2 family glycosyltransferase